MGVDPSRHLDRPRRGRARGSDESRAPARAGLSCGLSGLSACPRPRPNRILVPGRCLMRTSEPRPICVAIGLGVAAAALIAACRAPASQARSSNAEDLCPARLAAFDTLDYDVFTNRKGDRFSESHASDIVVSWPDGHDSHGLAKHIEDLKAMFVYAPNTSIQEHPIRICS